MKKADDKTNMFKFSDIGVFFCIFIFCFLFLMQSPLNLFCEYGNSTTDSSVFRTVATYMLEGGIPYKDSFDHKGPLLYILNYFGMLLGDFKGIWIIEFIGLLITFCFIYKIARMKLNKLNSLFVLFMSTSVLYKYFEGGNFTEEYAMPFIATSLFIFIDYFLNSKITRFRLCVCGASLAAVTLLRINMISLWIVFGIVVFVKGLIEKEYKELVKYFLFVFLRIYYRCFANSDVAYY